MIGAVVATSRLHAGRCSNYWCFGFSKTNIQSYFHRPKLFKCNQSSLRNQSFNSYRGLYDKIIKKDTSKWIHGTRQFLPNCCNKFQYSTDATKVSADVALNNPVNINTNIINNVLLFRYERPYMFKVALAFSICTLIGCYSMIDLIYLTLCQDLFNYTIDLKTRIVQHLLPIAIILIGFVGGPTIFFAVCYLTCRTVKYLILHKGGQTVTLITYHPIFKHRKLTVPLANISCTAARNQKANFIPLKVKNSSFHYVLEKSGHFLNMELFDGTVGVKRFGK